MDTIRSNFGILFQVPSRVTSQFCTVLSVLSSPTRPTLARTGKQQIEPNSVFAEVTTHDQ